MDLATAVLSFTLLAVVLTLTPGLDTALVLRAALTQGRREAFATGSGIVAGLFVRGAATAAGVSALFAASTVAFDVLRYAGAAYLVAFGTRLVVRSLRPCAEARPGPDVVRMSAWRAAGSGFATNLLNPRSGCSTSPCCRSSSPGAVIR